MFFSTIYRLRYSNGAADLLVVTCLHATARIILLIIMLYAVVRRFYINCISILLPVTPCYCITRRSTVSDSLLRIVASETEVFVLKKIKKGDADENQNAKMLTVSGTLKIGF